MQIRGVFLVIPDRWKVDSLNPQLRRWEHI